MPSPEQMTFYLYFVKTFPIVFVVCVAIAPVANNLVDVTIKEGDFVSAFCSLSKARFVSQCNEEEEHYRKVPHLGKV